MFQEGVPHKLSIAHDHIRSAIQLKALRGDEKSIHVLIMAANEIIVAYANHVHAPNVVDLNAHIRPDYRDVWRRVWVKAYNFFKHADRDPVADYDGPDQQTLAELNDLEILRAAANLRALNVRSAAPIEWYWRIVVALRPNVIDWNAIPEYREAFEAHLAAYPVGVDYPIKLAIAAEIQAGSIDPDEVNILAELARRLPEL